LSDSPTGSTGATSLGDTVIAGLHIAVWNDELVVSLPESNYCITYYRGPTSGWLLARDIPYRDDPHSKIKLSEFLAGASRSGQRQGARAGVDLTDLAASGEKLDDPHDAIHHKKKDDRHQDAERQAFCQSHLPIHGGTRGELDAA
jgi:hypothetical protein